MLVARSIEKLKAVENEICESFFVVCSVVWCVCSVCVVCVCV